MYCDMSLAALLFLCSSPPIRSHLAQTLSFIAYCLSRATDSCRVARVYVVIMCYAFDDTRAGRLCFDGVGYALHRLFLQLQGWFVDVFVRAAAWLVRKRLGHIR